MLSNRRMVLSPRSLRRRDVSLLGMVMVTQCERVDVEASLRMKVYTMNAHSTMYTTMPVVGLMPIFQKIMIECARDG